MQLKFETKKQTILIQVEPQKGKWLQEILNRASIYNSNQVTMQMLKQDYENQGLEDFELFWDNKPVNTLYKAGLLVI